MNASEFDGGLPTAFDVARGEVVVVDHSIPPQTFTWQGSAWTNHGSAGLPTSHPSGFNPNRHSAAMAHDLLRQKTVMFGGIYAGAFTDETWEWDGTSWIQHAAGAATKPPPTARASMAATTTGTVLLFGGIGSGATGHDLWEWDGTVWTNRTPPSLPPNWPQSRHEAALAYDTMRNRAVLFGGKVGPSNLPANDTWEYDGTSWTLISTPNAPSPRNGHSLVFDSLRGRMVLHGGSDGSSYQTDTWIYDGNNWSVVMPPTVGPDTYRGGMAYDSLRDQVVVIDPMPFTPISATWLFEDQPPAADTGPRDLVLLDADGDGDLDAATANSMSDSVSLWANNLGTLVESTVTLSVTDRAPVAIAAGDLDGDGQRDDVALACSDSDSVAIVLDLGGTPTLSTAGAGRRPSAIAVGDLDGNGTDDIVVGLTGTPVGGGQGLALSLNGGPFAAQTLPPGGADRVVAVATCDLDSDTNLDVAAVAQGSPDQLQLFLGDGTGALAFAGALDLATSGQAQSLCFDDVDGDGDLDLGVLLPRFPAAGSDLQWFTLAQAGALDPADYTTAAPIATGGDLALDIACGDANGNDLPGYRANRDAVVVHAGSAGAALFTDLDAVTSSFSATTALAVGSNPVAAAIGDLNGDCVSDIVVANQGSHDLSVTLSVALALTQSFGAGCSGTGSMAPVLSAAGGPPVLGNTAFGLEVTGGRPNAPMLALWSVANRMPAIQGCGLLLGSPFASSLRFTDQNGADTWAFGVPNDPALLCFELYFQTAIFDPAGAFGGFAALTNGLRGRVGS